MAPNPTHTGHLPQWTPHPPPVRQAQIRKHFKPKRPSPSGCKPSIDPTTVFPPARYVIKGITRPSAKTGNPLAKAVRVIWFPCHNQAMRSVSTDVLRTKGRRFGAPCTSPPLIVLVGWFSYPTHFESEDGICVSSEMLVATAETVRRHNQQTIM